MALLLWHPDSTCCLSSLLFIFQLFPTITLGQTPGPSQPEAQGNLVRLGALTADKLSFGKSLTRSHTVRSRWLNGLEKTAQETREISRLCVYKAIMRRKARAVVCYLGCPGKINGLAPMPGAEDSGCLGRQRRHGHPGCLGSPHSPCRDGNCVHRVCKTSREVKPARLVLPAKPWVYGCVSWGQGALPPSARGRCCGVSPGAASFHLGPVEEPAMCCASPRCVCATELCVSSG